MSEYDGGKEKDGHGKEDQHSLLRKRGTYAVQHDQSADTRKDDAHGRCRFITEDKEEPQDIDIEDTEDDRKSTGEGTGENIDQEIAFYAAVIVFQSQEKGRDTDRQRRY